MRLPKSLEPYASCIEASRRPACLLSRKPGPTKPWQSKIGGQPYFPFDFEPDLAGGRAVRATPWPKDQGTGLELNLLVQINFSEVPSLQGFPEEGILQIFVDASRWHALGRNFLTIFHTQVVEERELLFTDFGEVEHAEDRLSESALVFSSESEFITESDFRFAAHYHGCDVVPRFLDVFRGKTRIDYLSITDSRYRDHGEVGYGRNKLGGYHYSQNCRDPRARCPGGSGWDDSLLFLQLQDYDELSWGDAGGGQFFIKRADLARRDFSGLLFHWDST